MSNAIQNAAEDITLRATLLRIKRKADIMQMDAPRNTLSREQLQSYHSFSISHGARPSVTGIVRNSSVCVDITGTLIVLRGVLIAFLMAYMLGLSLAALPLGIFCLLTLILASLSGTATRSVRSCLCSARRSRPAPAPRTRHAAC